MSRYFWIKRILIVLPISFSIILMAQYFKSGNLDYAFAQAAIWGLASTLVYILVLWRKLKKNSSCAIQYEKTNKH